ncbi:hypothetical protein IKG48_03010 [Candidatus Saccharibacteria bacterium]|nr:hypothetical protein [Candidatus Saccharibacteria bacterium]
MMEYTREEAIEKILEMKEEYGHMPTEKDYKKDNTVNFNGLLKAMEAKNYSELNIKVLRELRKREGQSERILPYSRRELIALKLTEPEKYREYQEASREKRARVMERLHQADALKKAQKKQDLEDFRKPPEIMREIKEAAKETEMREDATIEQEVNTAQKEVKEMAKRGTRGKSWSREEIAELLEEFCVEYGYLPRDKDFLANYGAFSKMATKTPSVETVRRSLGRYRSDWPAAMRDALGRELKFDASKLPPVKSGKPSVKASVAKPQPAKAGRQSAKSKDENDDRSEMQEAANDKAARFNQDFADKEVNGTDFFRTVEIIKDMILDGRLEEIYQGASGAIFHISIAAAIGTVKLYFTADMEKCAPSPSDEELMKL